MAVRVRFPFRARAKKRMNRLVHPFFCMLFDVLLRSALPNATGFDGQRNVSQRALERALQGDSTRCVNFQRALKDLAAAAERNCSERRKKLQRPLKTDFPIGQAYSAQ